MQTIENIIKLVRFYQKENFIDSKYLRDGSFFIYQVKHLIKINKSGSQAQMFYFKKENDKHENAKLFIFFATFCLPS